MTSQDNTGTGSAASPGTTDKKHRILSGMRPTGRLHLGNLVGALENWVQHQDTCENYHLVADWHVLTTAVEKSAEIAENSRDMIIDWLGAGLDPAKSPMFIQSQIKEHAELHLLFSMLVSVARLERNPTVKEQARDLKLEATMSYGHLGYPVLQAADILLYKANLVPVGEDQLPHIEMTREIARRFNNHFGPVFPEPEGKLTVFPRLPGLDRNRMSKSLGNHILLSEEPENLEKKIRGAITDEKKLRKNDPGHPDVCIIFTYHKKFNPADVPEIETECKSGALGCVACKKNLTEKLTNYLAPFRTARAHYTAHPDEITDILKDGEIRARVIAQETMDEVRSAMQMG